jgi:hypothetical protein
MTEHPGKTDLSGRSSSCRPLIRRGGGRQSRRKQPTQAAPSRWNDQYDCGETEHDILS